MKTKMKIFQSQLPLFHIHPDSASFESPRVHTPQLTEDSQNFSKEDVDTIMHRLHMEQHNIHAFDYSMKFDPLFDRSTYSIIRFRLRLIDTRRRSIEPSLWTCGPHSATIPLNGPFPLPLFPLVPYILHLLHIVHSTLPVHCLFSP